MTNAFETMMAGFKTQDHDTALADTFQTLRRLIDASFKNLSEITKLPAKCLGVLTDMEKTTPKGTPTYRHLSKVYASLEADIKKLDLSVAVAANRNKTVKELIAFGSDDIGELAAISRLAKICYETNIAQTQICIEMNDAIFETIKELQKTNKQSM